MNFKLKFKPNTMLDNISGGHFVKDNFLSYSWQGNESYQSQSVVSGRTSKVTKGQLISKCPFGVIVWTKIPTKKFDKFLP